MSDAPGLGPRRAAAALLRGVIEHQKPLSDQGEAADGPLAALPPEDRARARHLASGVLRHMGRIDTLLGRFMKTLPLPPAVDALRLAAFEMLVDGVPPHAAVDSAVRLTRALGGHKRQTGLVNAVSRKLADQGPALWPGLPPGGPGAWLGPRIKSAYGKAALKAISVAHEAGAALDLTPKTRDPDAIAMLAEKVGGIVLPTGSIRVARRVQVSALPGFAEGAWWVQDAAAAVPVRLLGDVAGQSALDLCAAPGGKTLQLAAGGAVVSALDISADRLKRLDQNLTRTQLTAQQVVADALDWAPDTRFDVIVLDAPCSATGTLRRHPDLPHVRPEPNLAPLLALQSRLLDRALDWLAPGGRLVYATCSLLPEEGEDQLAAVLARHPGLEPVPPSDGLGLDPAWTTAQGGLRLRPDHWPELGGMDGFFAAVLTR